MPIEKTRNYCRVRKTHPGKFDPRSFRTIRRGKVKMVIACPKGKWKNGRCRAGTRVQSMLYPKTSRHCR